MAPEEETDLEAEEAFDKKEEKENQKPVLTITMFRGGKNMVGEALFDPILLLETKNRAEARAIQRICKANEVPCVVTVTPKPRVVKFKGVD